MMFKSSMNNRRMGALLSEFAEIAEGQPGYWIVNYAGRQLVVITDEAHNRMRIITSVQPAAEVSADVLTTLLHANFDRALDAKYALDEGQVWSVFTHPLKELKDAQFADALKQVATLADNFGSSFSSSDLVFAG